MNKYVLISVYDKKKILSIAKYIHSMNYKILTTKGTGKILKKNKIPVIFIDKYINFPEILNGRIKSIHPKLFGGILCKRNSKKDLKDIKNHNIFLIDIIIINLYPFEKVINNKYSSFDNIIENIDIGGLSLLRAGAKNFQYVTSIYDIKDYKKILKNGLKFNYKDRINLATKVFKYIYIYEKLIFNYFKNLIFKINKKKKYPKFLNLNFKKIQNLRYGENPHQTAALYKFHLNNDNYNQIHGKVLSYNNILDFNTAWECVISLKKKACVIVKHSNICGVAIRKNCLKAFKRAFETDRISSFGGIIAFNSKITSNVANEIIKYFIELVIAPNFSFNAINILKKKKNLILIKKKKNILNKYSFKSINYNLLIQESNKKNIKINKLKIVSKKIPNQNQLKDSIFAWKIVKFIKSNAIVFCLNQATLCIGSGQTSRIDSVKMAIFKSKQFNINLKNSIIASDAFFPFKDNIENIFNTGAICIIQPGGSVRDKEVIDIVNNKNLIMLFTNIRNFIH